MAQNLRFGNNINYNKSSFPNKNEIVVIDSSSEDVTCLSDCKEVIVRKPESDALQCYLCGVTVRYSELSRHVKLCSGLVESEELLPFYLKTECRVKLTEDLVATTLRKCGYDETDVANAVSAFVTEFQTRSPVSLTRAEISCINNLA